jgi:C4-dicarboxylate-specific signal transduction histidine kinase
MNFIIIILSFVIVTLVSALYYIYRRYLEITKKLEQERMATIQSTRLASLGEMAAGVTHEINNPLAVIIGRSEMILSQIKDGSATQEEISISISKMNSWY